MVIVLQLDEQNTSKASDTSYSMLESIMNLLSEKNFKSMAHESGMMETEGNRIILDSGKAFYVEAYEKIV